MSEFIMIELTDGGQAIIRKSDIVRVRGNNNKTTIGTEKYTYTTQHTVGTIYRKLKEG